MSKIKNLKIISCNKNIKISRNNLSPKLKLVIPKEDYYYDHNYVNNSDNSIIDDIPSDDFYHLLNQELKKELTKSLTKIRKRYHGKYEK